MMARLEAKSQAFSVTVRIVSDACLSRDEVFLVEGKAVCDRDHDMACVDWDSLTSGRPPHESPAFRWLVSSLAADQIRSSRTGEGSR